LFFFYSALASNAKDVPYGKSKLTQLLSDGLGGNAKCLMFVTASPADVDINETIHSFEFALKCKQVQNLKPGAAVESAEVRSLKEQLNELQSKVGNAKPTELV
jgi:hypothetical protein